MNSLRKTLIFTGIFILAGLNTAQAGIFGCSNSDPRTMDEEVLVHPSGESEATIKLVKAYYSCDLTEGDRLRVEISFKKLSDAPLPSHGFLSATVTSFAPWGHRFHQRHFDRSAMTSVQYPFSTQASDVKVELEEFGSVRLIH